MTDNSVIRSCVLHCTAGYRPDLYPPQAGVQARQVSWAPDHESTQAGDPRADLIGRYFPRVIHADVEEANTRAGVLGDDFDARAVLWSYWP